jgi:tetratricopeptide (TPR) repeat protein
MHRKPPAVADLPQPVADVSDKVVAESPAPPSPPNKAVADPPAPSVGADSSSDYQQISEQAAQAHAKQQFAEEARLWQDFVDHSPTSQQACPAIGLAYERRGDLDKAITASKKCASLEPGQLDLSLAIAHVLQAKSEFSRAGEIYRQCLAKDPNNMDARNGLALVALKQNRLKEAADAANTVLRDNSANTDALLITGIVAWREHKLDDAERIFRRGLTLDDQRADFHAFLGRIEESKGRPADALAQYDKVLALDPNDSEISERRDRLQGVR